MKLEGMWEVGMPKGNVDISSQKISVQRQEIYSIQVWLMCGMFLYYLETQRRVLLVIAGRILLMNTP